METNRFPLISLGLAGSRPGGRVTSLRRQRSNQERRPRRAGRLLKRCLIRRLPCAAHNRRPARNSRAAPAQTAAPDFPACCCAARRLGRGFPESPSVAARAGVIGGKRKAESGERRAESGERRAESGKKWSACRGEGGVSRSTASRRRSRPGVQTRPWNRDPANVRSINGKPLVSISSRRSPPSELAHPRSDLRRPRSDLAHPRSDLLRPRSELAHPRSDLRRPRSELAHPRSDLCHPRSDLAHPHSNLTRAPFNLRGPGRVPAQPSAFLPARSPHQAASSNPE